MHISHQKLQVIGVWIIQMITFGNKIPMIIKNNFYYQDWFFLFLNILSNLKILKQFIIWTVGFTFF